MKQGCVFLGFVFASILLADTPTAFRRLPIAVQTAAKQQANGGKIVGASREIEKGQTTYEVETRLDGKSRDLSFDKAGNLLAVEEEVGLDTIPAPAQAAIRKQLAGGTIKKIESITQGNSVSYEAAILTKSGKHLEIAVNSDGTPHPD